MLHPNFHYHMLLLAILMYTLMDIFLRLMCIMLHFLHELRFITMVIHNLMVLLFHILCIGNFHSMFHHYMFLSHIHMYSNMVPLILYIMLRFLHELLLLHPIHIRYTVQNVMLLLCLLLILALDLMSILLIHLYILLHLLPI